MNLQSIFRVMTLVVVMLAVNSNVNAQTAETAHQATPSELVFTVRSATLEVGDTKTLTVTGLERGERAEWTSSDKEIVTVEKDGTITARKEGKATITIVAGDRKATCNVTVTAKATDARTNNVERPTTNEAERSATNEVEKTK
jgi:uncharacterized protein YjdB